MSLNFDDEKLHVTTTKTVRLNYDGEYDLGTILLNGKDEIISIEYWDENGNFTKDKDVYLTLESAKDYLYSIFKLRIKAKYQKLIKENDALNKLLENFK